MTGHAILAALLAGTCAALAVGVVVRPPRPLRARLRPYTVVTRSRLGRAPDLPIDASGVGSTMRRLFGPPVAAAARRFGRLVDSASEDQLLRKLRQAARLQEVPEERRVHEYRIRQLLSAGTGTAIGLAVGVLSGRSTAVALALGAVGLAGGVAWWRSLLDRAIEERASRMRIELYTVNQLIAMRIRVGGGVVATVRRLCRNGRGVVFDELAEALRLHQGGLPAGDAFRRIAATTAEPHAARTYRVLAAADERGSDVAAALLALSEDIREDRREALRRRATRRRATMLIPIIGILAPILILFVAAPLPWIVLQGLN